MISERSSDTDNYGYDRPPAKHNARLTEVGRGTPGGEYMRRYWHPVAIAAKVNQRPQRVRLLGEDLVLFRKPDGALGLLHERCSHRGTSLYYGKVEDAGIRCCYHGWQFDVDGTCMDQPCEPNGGLNRNVARQPWYFAEEQYGFVFAYLGPVDRKPPLPRIDILEDLEPGEQIELDDASFFGGGSADAPIIPMNYLQVFENVMDPYHVYVLHAAFSGTQFQREFGVMPEITWEVKDDGVTYFADRNLSDGRKLHRVTQVVLPYVRIVPTTELTPGRGNEVGWLVPVDDTHFRSFGAARVREPGTFTRRSRKATHNGKLWGEMTEEEHQLYPGDMEAQLSQGPITQHSEEHLASTDKGVIMLRRLMLKQIDAVERGEDPVGVARDASARVEVAAGNYFSDPA